ALVRHAAAGRGAGRAGDGRVRGGSGATRTPQDRARGTRHLGHAAWRSIAAHLLVRGIGSRDMAIVEREIIKGEQPPTPEAEPSPAQERLPLGPLKTIHVYWLAGMSCDGCTISVAGATNRGIEGLLAGVVPAMPKVILHHPVLSAEAGAEFVRSFADAWEGKLGAPYVVVFEGSVADERIAGRTGGYFSALGGAGVEGG